MNMDLKLQTIILFVHIDALFALWRAPPAERIRIYLDEDESLIIPKHQSELKIFSPVIVGDKIYTDIAKINKKPLKYVKHTPVSKLKSSLELASELADVGKKCCENEWTLNESKEVDLEELFRPVSLPALHSSHIHEYHNFEDIKPVTEHIEDDLKYDFRTKTYSFR